MEKIVRVKPNADYTIEIVTSGGRTGVFDVKPYMSGVAFKELADISYFMQVRSSHYGIAWPHEQDISSDTILCDIESSHSK